MPSLSTFGVRTSHRPTWTHKIHHGLDLGEAITFPLVVYYVPLHKAHIQMAFESLKLGILATLGAHNFICKPPIDMKSEAKL
jgi:hypothetical protein